MLVDSNDSRKRNEMEKKPWLDQMSGTGSQIGACALWTSRCQSNAWLLRKDVTQLTEYGPGWGSDFAPYSMRNLEATGIPGFTILHYTYAYIRSVYRLCNSVIGILCCRLEIRSHFVASITYEGIQVYTWIYTGNRSTLAHTSCFPTWWCDGCDLSTWEREGCVTTYEITTYGRWIPNCIAMW